MSYSSDLHSHSVRLSGDGIDVSLSVVDFQGGATPLGWFSDETSTLFGRIEDLEVEGCHVPADFPWDERFDEEICGGYTQTCGQRLLARH